MALAVHLAGLLGVGEQRGEQARERRREANFLRAHDRLRLQAQEPQQLIDVLVEGGAQPSLRRAARGEPAVDGRPPAELHIAHIGDARAGDGRRRRVVQVFWFEERLHVGHEHLNAIAVRQREHLVVVKHGVEVLNPDGVNGTVEDDPGVVLLFALAALRHSTEKTPSVQSPVDASSRPNIWGAVMALGFIRHTTCLGPTSDSAPARHS